MNQTEVLDVLKRTGALMEGHFKLSSGRHSDTYVQKQMVFQHPRLTASLGEAVAERAYCRGSLRTEELKTDLERACRIFDGLRQAARLIQRRHVERNDDRVLVHPSIFTCPLISSSDAMPCASQKSARARAIVSVAVGS